MRFLVDGGRVHADQTPEDLDMDDGDIYWSHCAQIGLVVVYIGCVYVIK